MREGDREALAAEVVNGVHVLGIGPGAGASNVYFVSSGSSWTLIDAGWSNSAGAIYSAAESLFGPGARPESIVLTHIHPDHSGSALQLARAWEVRVFAHPGELPLAAGRLVPEYANPLDRWMIGPVLRLMPRDRVDSMVSEGDISEVIAELDLDRGIPGVPDWEVVPTPGHTPGHIAFLRRPDRVLITGDAVLTVNVNSPTDLLRAVRRVSGPPRITTWAWPLAVSSIARLADVEPSLLAGGHGRPMAGDVSRELRDFADGEMAKLGRALARGSAA